MVKRRTVQKGDLLVKALRRAHQDLSERQQTEQTERDKPKRQSDSRVIETPKS